jgi:hypothetical protein
MVDKRIVGTMHINDPKTWVPGCLMTYNDTFVTPPLHHPFTGVGLIVANDGTHVSVLWGANCRKVFRTYPVTSLNTTIIYRVVE